MIKTKKCPVCEMLLLKSDNVVQFKGINFWLCSEQCRDRFNQRPSLYIGDPKHGKSVKQHGVKVEKKHTIKLVLPDNHESIDLLIQYLNSLMGVIQARINQGQLEIEYDLIQVSLGEIESFIKSTGIAIEQSWIDKVHNALIHYNEDGELDNLGHPYKDN